MTRPRVNDVGRLTCLCRDVKRSKDQEIRGCESPGREEGKRVGRGGTSEGRGGFEGQDGGTSEGDSGDSEDDMREGIGSRE